MNEVKHDKECQQARQTTLYQRVVMLSKFGITASEAERNLIVGMVKEINAELEFSTR